MNARRQRVWDLYDEYYAKGAALFAEYSPCNIKALPKGTTQCSANPPTLRIQREEKNYGDERIAPYPYDRDGLCCVGCKHLGSLGCTVEALGCKLWLCWEMKDRHPKLEEKLHQLRTRAARDGVPMGIRASKEENFQAWDNKQPQGAFL